MSTQDNGGPAFPHPGGSRDASVQESYLGMTLRDYFAAHEPIDPKYSIGRSLAEMLVGRALPVADGNGAACPLAVTTFWAESEAKYRYLRADAMLKARAQ